MGDRTGSRGGGVRTFGRAFASVVLAAFVTAASGQDKAPGAPAPAAKPDAMEAEVDAIGRAVAASQWKSAKIAIERFLAAHGDDPRILAHLAVIESDLAKCTFRMSERPPGPLELFGRAATKFDPVSLRAEFDVREITGEMGWHTAGSVRFFDVLFDGDVSVEMTEEMSKKLTVLLGFDYETQVGIAFKTGPGADSYETNVYLLDLRRTDTGDPAPLGPAQSHEGFFVRAMRFALGPTKATVEVQFPKGWSPPQKVRTYSIPSWKKGFVAVASAKGGAILLRIEGKVDARFAQRTLAEADSRRFRAWAATGWKREAVLPASVLALEKAAGAWADDVPADCPQEWRDTLCALQRAAFEEPDKAAKAKPVTGLSGATADWQDALIAYAARRYADAESSARRAIAAAPSFAPAYAIAGRALLRHGDEAAALPLLEEARRRGPSFAPAYDGLALIALAAGDAERMRAVLSDQAAAGVATSLTAVLRTAQMRLARGPDWKKRYDAVTANFTVTGDTSAAVCTDVAKTLEEAAAIYQRQFRARPPQARARVRVFSGFASYADYVSDFGADPSNTLGMYMPALRELCIWLHEDRPELSNTIRHEAFHQYLHTLIDDVPIWFNEGHAEFFGFSRRKLGKALVGQTGDDQAEFAKLLLPKFEPLPDLFLMDQETFMKDATLHYVQAWAVVHLLRDPNATAFHGVLDRYLDALLAGRSPSDAYTAVLEPVLPRIAAALPGHVKGLK